MSSIEKARKRNEEVESLIRFMKVVENPEWMIDLVTDMKNAPAAIIEKLNEEKKVIYDRDGMILQQNTTISINDAIRLVMDICSYDPRVAVTNQINRAFLEHLVINDIRMRDSGWFILVKDTIYDLIERYDLVNKPAIDFSIKDDVEDNIMESLCDVLMKDGHGNPLSAVDINILRTKIRETFRTYCLFV